MKKRGLDLSLLDDVVDTLRQGKQLDTKYHDHELSGKFKGFRECLQILTERSACSGGTAHPFRFKRRETPL